MKERDIKLYEMLKARLGPQEAEAFLSLLEYRFEGLKARSGSQEAEAFLSLLNHRAKELEAKQTLLATKMDIANAKAEIIKWMFIFWIGQLGAFVAMIKLLL